MKAIAKRGPHELALVDDGASPDDPDLQVMLSNTLTGETMGPFPWQSMLARGYWEPIDEPS